MILILSTGSGMDNMVILDVEYIVRVGLNPVRPMGEILAGWLDNLFRLVLPRKRFQPLRAVAAASRKRLKRNKRGIGCHKFLAPVGASLDRVNHRAEW